MPEKTGSTGGMVFVVVEHELRGAAGLAIRETQSIVFLPIAPAFTPPPRRPGPTGSLVIDVDKRAHPHFSVETPFLAAVVKGTKFGVNVGANSASVEVERGLVEVDDFAMLTVSSCAAGQESSSPCAAGAKSERAGSANGREEKQ